MRRHRLADRGRFDAYPQTRPFGADMTVKSPEDALEIVRSLTGGLDPSRLVTHHFALNEFEAGYDVFALKVVAVAGPVAAN